MLARCFFLNSEDLNRPSKVKSVATTFSLHDIGQLNMVQGFDLKPLTAYFCRRQKKNPNPKLKKRESWGIMNIKCKQSLLAIEGLLDKVLALLSKPCEQERGLILALNQCLSTAVTFLILTTQRSVSRVINCEKKSIFLLMFSEFKMARWLISHRQILRPVKLCLTSIPLTLFFCLVWFLAGLVVPSSTGHSQVLHR